MKHIYNEGRIVGLNQYEAYVRQLLSTRPEDTPMTEREWLTSSTSSASMILKVPSGTEAGYADFILPEGSQLCGCSTIYASVFEGEVTLDSSGRWAVSVEDYGQLIDNVEYRHPVTPGMPENVPTKYKIEGLTDAMHQRCMNYSRITSGLMIQPGE